MKKYFSLICALATLSFIACAHTPATNPDPNHTHADFAVWIDGKRLDFSGPEFMSGTSDENDPDHEKHHKYLHLHDGNGHVIHRHKPGLKFFDFLLSVGFTFHPDVGLNRHCITISDGRRFCNETDESDALSKNSWHFFVNGVPFSDASGSQMYGGIINYVFHDGDQLLLTYGADTSEIQNELRKMTDDACRYSKTCPWKGAPPTENCIADPEVPCSQ